MDSNEKLDKLSLAGSEETRKSPPELPFNLEYAVEGIKALEQWILRHSEHLPRRDYRVGLALLDDLREHITWEPLF